MSDGIEGFNLELGSLLLDLVSDRLTSEWRGFTLTFQARTDDGTHTLDGLRLVEPDSGVSVPQCARWLTNIARDLRAAGDVQLVRLSDDGVSQEPLSLGGELELVALQLDFEGVIARAAADNEEARRGEG